jgi:hypothetical protein
MRVRGREREPSLPRLPQARTRVRACVCVCVCVVHGHLDTHTHAQGSHRGRGFLSRFVRGGAFFFLASPNSLSPVAATPRERGNAASELTSLPAPRTHSLFAVRVWAARALVNARRSRAGRPARAPPADAAPAARGGGRHGDDDGGQDGEGGTRGRRERGRESFWGWDGSPDRPPPPPPTPALTHSSKPPSCAPWTATPTSPSRCRWRARCGTCRGGRGKRERGGEGCVFGIMFF